jgi:aspartyl-tRNA(Asn)/glutamyl-tRNA(Gln) amidotransferase subunit C
MTAARHGQFKDDVYSRYTAGSANIRATNRFDSPAPVRLVSVSNEREDHLKLTDMEFSGLEVLARVDLDPGERDRLRLQLGRILGFVRRLEQAEPGGSGEGCRSAFIPAPPSSDEPRECLDREEVLGQAPAREGGFFRVPPVIGGDDGGGS